jgi:acetyl-CoA C-acetyltransferase
VTAQDPVVLVSGFRTAIGKFGGVFKDIDAPHLAAECIRAAVEAAHLDPAEVDEVVMGQVGQVGPDAYNARRAAIAAGLPPATTAMNVNRLCGSGLQAIITGTQEILTGQAQIVVAGGNESMSRQPFLDYGARSGWRLGPRESLDGTLSMITDPFGRYPMGVTAEKVADRFDISRRDQDEFAFRSQRLAVEAIARRDFEREIVPVTPPRAPGPVTVDEHPRETTLEKLASLTPAFRDGGSVTAGNSSGINDGAAALVLMRRSEAHKRGLEPRREVTAWAVTGVEPEIMGFAPAVAIPRVLAKAGLSVDDIDIVELNEAFAAQALAVIRDARLDPDRVNPAGGAIAMGHPIGATGAILTVKLMNALERFGGQRGMVTMCMGGGQGYAAVFSRS